MERSPRVSVVIPARDAAATLGNTLNSIAADADMIAEIVVVDDGSADDTAAAARQAGAALGLPLRVIANPGRRGAGAARNAGLRAARQDLVYFIDADDALIPGGLKALRDRLAAAPDAGIAVGGYIRRVAGRPDKLCPAGRFAAAPAANVRRYLTDEVRSIAMGSGLVRRSAIGPARFAEDLVYEEDTVFWIMALAAARVVTHDSPVLIYNVSIARSDERFAAAPARAYLQASRSFRHLVAHGALDRDTARLRKSLIALKTARVCYRAGDVRAAARFMALVDASGLGIIRRWQTLRYRTRIAIDRRRAAAPPAP